MDKDQRKMDWWKINAPVRLYSYLRKFYCIYLIKQENNYQILSPDFLHVSVVLVDNRHDRPSYRGSRVVILDLVTNDLQNLVKFVFN